MPIDTAVQLSLDGPAINTELRYRHISAEGQTAETVAVLPGRVGREDLARMLPALVADLYFIPSQVGLPDLVQAPEREWNEDMDTVWHELLAIGYTDAEPTGWPASALSAAWPASDRDWDERAAVSRVCRTCEQPAMGL